MASAQPAALAVVNSASYGDTIAPDSLATVFGNGLSQGTASATLDANGQLPTELASTRVEIGGVAAPLVYVSPTQINLVVPGGLTAGTVTVLIRNLASGGSKSGTALVAATAPGVFTSDTSGTGPGAILNAITYGPAPFLVETGTGADPRTRLAVYGTGWRHADKVTATAQDSAGNRSTLTVEYAGEAPGFFGLDQLNILLVPDVDGAKTVSLSVAADDNPANIVTFQMGLLPASSLRLATIALSADLVISGDSPTLTVGLNGVARSGGLVVGLRSETSVAQVSPQLTIPEGKASAQVRVTTSAVSVRSFAILTAQAGGSMQQISLAIDPANSARLAGLSISAPSILGGRSLTGTVTLADDAQGSVNVAVSSDNSKVSVPTPVTVPFGRRTADFPITTTAVTGTQSAVLTATLGPDNKTATLTVMPPLELALDATSVVGGDSATGTVTLGDAAPAAGATITLSSGDPTVHVPTVSIPGGQRSQTFTLTTTAVNATRTVSITAAYGGNSRTVTLTVTPPAVATLANLTISPNQVVGGTSTQGTVTLTAPAGNGGLRVDLQSSQILTATVPLFLIVTQGQSSAAFTINTTHFPNTVTITATAGAVKKTASLKVQ